MVSATPHLTAQELDAALRELDIEQLELARLVNAGSATVKRWLAGTSPVPGCASLVIRLLLARPELKELIGVRPRSGRGRPRKPR